MNFDTTSSILKKYITKECQKHYPYNNNKKRLTSELTSPCKVHPSSISQPSDAWTHVFSTDMSGGAENGKHSFNKHSFQIKF